MNIGKYKADHIIDGCGSRYGGSTKAHELYCQCKFNDRKNHKEHCCLISEMRVGYNNFEPGYVIRNGTVIILLHEKAL